MNADDTKCYRPVRALGDAQYLQHNLDDVNQWAQVWGVNVNKCKCEVHSVTRNVMPVSSATSLRTSHAISKT